MGIRRNVANIKDRYEKGLCKRRKEACGETERIEKKRRWEEREEKNKRRNRRIGRQEKVKDSEGGKSRHTL